MSFDVQHVRNAFEAMKGQPVFCSPELSGIIVRRHSFGVVLAEDTREIIADASVMFDRLAGMIRQDEVRSQLALLLLAPRGL